MTPQSSYVSQSGMDGEAQAHTSAVGVKASPPQAHPEATPGPLRHSHSLPSQPHCSPCAPYTARSAGKGWSAPQPLGAPFPGCPPHLQRAQSAGRELIWSPALAGSLLRTCYAVALANIWLWAPAPPSDGSWWERRRGWRQCGQRSHARLPLPECVPGVLPSQPWHSCWPAKSSQGAAMAAISGAAAGSGLGPSLQHAQASGERAGSGFGPSDGAARVAEARVSPRRQGAPRPGSPAQLLAALAPAAPRPWGKARVLPGGPTARAWTGPGLPEPRTARYGQRGQPAAPARLWDGAKPSGLSGRGSSLITDAGKEVES